MKKFKFELEDILSLRKFEQEQTQIELGKAVAEEQAIQDKLNMIAMQHSDIVKNTSGSVDFSVIANRQNYISFLNKQRDYLLEELARAKLITEAKREIFQKALQKTQALSKLKDKQLELYKVQEGIEEDNLVDDIVTANASRQ